MLLLHLPIDYKTCMYCGIPTQDITQTNLQVHVHMPVTRQRELPYVYVLVALVPLHFA